MNTRFKLETSNGKIYLVKMHPFVRIEIGRSKLSALYLIEEYRQLNSLHYSIVFELINKLYALRAPLYEKKSQEKEFDNLFQFRFTESEFLKDHFLCLPELIHYKSIFHTYFVLYYRDLHGKSVSSKQLFFKDDAIAFIESKINTGEIPEDDGKNFIFSIKFSLTTPENKKKFFSQNN